MNELALTRTPELIAAEIKGIKEQTKRQVLYNSIEIGRKLTEAKEIIAHGEWGNWLEGAVDYSKSTANNLMKIFEEYGADQLTLLMDNAKSQAFGDLSYSQAIILLGVPTELREDFIKDNKADEISTRELKKRVDEIKRLKKDLAEQKEITNIAKDQAEAITQISIGIKKKHEEEERKYEEEINQVRVDLEDKENKIKELEKRPIEVNTVEKDELDKLKAEKEELKTQLEGVQASIQNDSVIRYAVYFSGVQEEFTKLLEELEKIPPEEAEPFRNATKQILTMMLERL